jgi:hypothetical protein
MKELTKGKLVAIILFVIFISNTIVYYMENGSPYNTPFAKADAWTAFTGISLGVVLIFGIMGIVVYIIDNWEEKL